MDRNIIKKNVTTFGFGESVAVSGNGSTYVVGDSQEDKVYVYKAINGELIVTIIASDLFGIGFGCDVDITYDGLTIIVGTVVDEGAYIYKCIDNVWKRIAKLSTKSACKAFGDNVTISSNGLYSYIVDLDNGNLHIYENGSYLEICILKRVDCYINILDIAVSYDGTTIALIGHNEEHWTNRHDIHIFKLVDTDIHKDYDRYMECRYVDKYLVKYHSLKFDEDNKFDIGKTRIAISGNGNILVVSSPNGSTIGCYENVISEKSFKIFDTIDIEYKSYVWGTREITLSENGDICNIAIYGEGELKRFRNKKVGGFIEEYSEKLSSEVNKGFGFKLAASANGRDVIVGYDLNDYVYLIKSNENSETKMFLKKKIPFHK